MKLKLRRKHLILTSMFAAACSCFSAPASASVKSIDGLWSALPNNVFVPSARREHTAIYNASHNRYLLFGGFGFASSAPENNFNEVWTLTLDGTPTWTELFPSGIPPAGRLGSVSVHDPLRQRFVGFGGTDGAPVDTGSLDLSGDPAWAPIDPGAQRPEGSYGMVSVTIPGMLDVPPVRNASREVLVLPPAGRTASSGPMRERGYPQGSRRLHESANRSSSQ